jgi:hypothetical protein
MTEQSAKPEEQPQEQPSSKRSRAALGPTEIDIAAAIAPASKAKANTERLTKVMENGGGEAEVQEKIKEIRQELKTPAETPRSVEVAVPTFPEPARPPAKQSFFARIGSFFSRKSSPTEPVQKTAPIQKTNIEGTEKGWLLQQELKKPTEEVKPTPHYSVGAPSHLVGEPTKKVTYASENLREKGWLQEKEQPQKEPVPQGIVIEDAPIRLTNNLAQEPNIKEGVPKKWLTKSGVETLDKEDTIKELDAYFATNQRNSMLFSGREQVEQSLKAEQLLQHLRKFNVPAQGLTDFQEKLNRDTEDAMAQMVMDIVNSKGDRETELARILSKEHIGSYTGPKAKQYVRSVLEGILAQRPDNEKPKEETTKFLQQFLQKYR